MKILAHAPFIGTSGYANHARSFFCALNKYHTVKVRNFTIGNSWKGMNDRPHDGEPYFTKEMSQMLIQQTLFNTDNTRSDYNMYGYKNDFKPDVHIVLMETNNHYYYDNYEGYKIAYNVWESTRYPDDFFKRLFYFDEVWVPSEWQYESLIEQGYPKERIFVVPEGVDVETFVPTKKVIKKKKFRFIHFGRWDYRKSTTEILKAFGEEFKDDKNVELVCNVENHYPFDGMKTTQERVEKYGIDTSKIKFLNFLPREEYIKYLQEGDVFLSCARSEGWNLPLCVPKNKLIFSNEKLIPISEVKIGDFVVSHNGNEKKVVELMKRKYDGEIVNIKLFGDYEELSLTPEHPVYVIKREEFITKKDRFKEIQSIEPKWVESKNIKKGDIIIRTELPQKYFENEIIDLLTIDDSLKYDNEFVWYNTGYNSNSKLKKYKRFINLWDLSYLFGWYISEGTDGKNRLVFTLNAEKEIDVALKIISEIKKIFGITGSYKIKNNTLIVKFYSVLLCRFFTHFCNKLSYNKKIPEKILLGPKDVLSVLIDNMFLGDGNKTSNFFQYTTVSEILTRQLVFANQRLGIKSRAQLAKRKRESKRPCYVISWNEDNSNFRHSNKTWKHPKGFAILVKNVNKSRYDDFVYNVEVEDDNSYLLSNATVHNCEAMACGTPSIYSNYSGQLQFAKGKGIPVEISHLRKANIAEKDQPGEYCEPDWNDFKLKMRDAYNNFKSHKEKALQDSKKIHEEFNWDRQARIADNRLWEKIPKIAEYRNKDVVKPFAFVTTGNIGYMPVIEKLVQSLLEFSEQKIIVYGVDCEVPFDYPNVIKRKITPPKISEHDKWYWKQHACIASLEEEYDNYVWIDGDVVVNYNVDNIRQYFDKITNYPLSDIHVQEEFFGTYGGKSQLFNEELSKEWGINKKQPYMHVCLYVYNKSCDHWFKEIIKHYQNIMKTNPGDYKRLFLWNDEGIDNAMRWKYGYTEHLPLTNFDTSSYDGDAGFIDKTLHHFYKFWNEEGPQNFNRIFGYQYIPKDKSNILYFHGNKNAQISDKMVQFIKMKRDNSFWKSKCFYTDIYKIEDYEPLYDIEGGTMDIASRFGWAPAIFHEIYNLKDYYKQHEEKMKIKSGHVVVDLGGNIGVFNKWAHQEGASKVISFEPDKRYFKLLKLNAGPNSILFNAAVSDTMGEFMLYESSHLGGSTLIEHEEAINKYPVRTYTLDYLFETKLIDRIDYLKVDIEGAEQHAMMGISDENLMKVRNIGMEYHHNQFNHNDELRQDLISRLNRLGFNSYLLFCGQNNNLQLIYFWR